MKLLSKHIVASTLVVGLATPLSAFATNGYFLIGYGAKSRGMGGVGVAYPQDGMASAYNPAAMGLLRKDYMTAGGELFFPDRAVFRQNGNNFNADTNVTSEGNVYLIPSMGGQMRIDSKMTMGMSVIGAGLGTRYRQTFGNFYWPILDPTINVDDQVGVDMKQMQMLPSLSYKINSNHIVGASLALGLQVFKASGLEAFGVLGFANDLTKLTGNGVSTSYGMGVRLGWIGQFMKKKLTLGANYASKVYMTRFEKYEALFAEHGKFDIPEHITLGLAYKANKKTNIAFDIQRIYYSNVASIGNPGPSATDPNEFNPLCPGTDSAICLTGGDLGLGFGWQDMTIYKLGIDYQYSKKLTLRAGWNYGKMPILSDEILFNMLAPATVEHHATIGFTYEPDRNTEYSVNYMHAFNETLTGKNMFYPAGVTNYEDHAQDTTAISMKQDAIGFGFSYKF